MASLADLPELVGFFSYSREDDIDSNGALSALRNRIQAELRVQLGRTAKSFRLWQDKEAIASGTMWESEIKNAVAQSVFFIPIITPTVVASTYCKFELEQFLARELVLGRDDLVFPILYVDVPALQDDLLRQNDPALLLIARRQYADWREMRYLDITSTEVRREIGRFCTDIRDAVRRSWLTPEERRKQDELDALRREEEERRSRESEATRRAEDARRKQEAEAQRAANEHRKQQASAQRTGEEERQRKDFESKPLINRLKLEQKTDERPRSTQPARFADGSAENDAKRRLRSPVLAGLLLAIGAAYVFSALYLLSGLGGGESLGGILFTLVPAVTAIFLCLSLLGKIRVPDPVLILVIVCALGACIVIDGLMWWNLGLSSLEFRRPYFLVGLVAMATLIATLGKVIAATRK